MEFKWDSDDGATALKAGLFGISGTGKTFTAALLALVTRKALGLKGPISMFDTEGGSVYIREMIERETGQKFLVKRARSFDDLLAWGKAIQTAGVSIGIADSVSHPWTEICDSYLQQKNAARAKAKKEPLSRLSFEDWAVIKPTWAQWTNLFLNSPVSMIVCAREGVIWGYEENEEGKKELRKLGVKMRTENEFGYEPSLMLYMEREQDLEGDTVKVVRRATVLKDRFNKIDAQTFTFPTEASHALAEARVAKAFAPHIAMLASGKQAEVDTERKTPFDVNVTGDSAYAAERRVKEILAEEIKGEMTSMFPGQTVDEKRSRTDMLFKIFGTRSETAIETMDVALLRTGLQTLRGVAEKVKETANA